mgnify:CR=1 FL=1
MKIGLDYDGTITRDKAFWKAFIYMAKAAGHEVFIVTMRYEHEPVDMRMDCLVYYTERKAKQPFMARQGIQIDIWIDDNPQWVGLDSA